MLSQPIQYTGDITGYKLLGFFIEFCCLSIKQHAVIAWSANLE